MSHPVIHFEIGGSDGGRLAGFYGDLFGWKIQDAGPGYWLVTPEDSGIGGGLMQTRAGMPSYVTVYVATDDLQATLDRAVELGGAQVVEPTEIPGVGWFALFRDPDDNIVGLLREG
jgi:predicted enzyme related to lactoylglutathione lyase